jgi:hypothetical protein
MASPTTIPQDFLATGESQADALLFGGKEKNEDLG